MYRRAGRGGGAAASGSGRGAAGTGDGGMGSASAKVALSVGLGARTARPQCNGNRYVSEKRSMRLSTIARSQQHDMRCRWHLTRHLVLCSCCCCSLLCRYVTRHAELCHPDQHQRNPCTGSLAVRCGGCTAPRGLMTRTCSPLLRPTKRHVSPLKLVVGSREVAPALTHTDEPACGPQRWRGNTFTNSKSWPGVRNCSL